VCPREGRDGKRRKARLSSGLNSHNHTKKEKTTGLLSSAVKSSGARVLIEEEPSGGERRVNRKLS